MRAHGSAVVFFLATRGWPYVLRSLCPADTHRPYSDIESDDHDIRFHLLSGRRNLHRFSPHIECHTGSVTPRTLGDQCPDLPRATENARSIGNPVATLIRQKAQQEPADCRMPLSIFTSPGTLCPWVRRIGRWCVQHRLDSPKVDRYERRL